jgi:hypothetical protein
MDPSVACKELLSAIARRDWNTFLGLLEPDALGILQREELAAACHWFEALERGERRGMPVQGVICDVILRPESLHRFGEQHIRGLPGQPTLAELAADSPRAFVERFRLAVSLTPTNASGEFAVVPEYDVLGEEIEQDRAVIHLRIRGDPDDDFAQTHMVLRQVAGEWRACAEGEVRLALPSLWFYMDEPETGEAPA